MKTLRLQLIDCKIKNMKHTNQIFKGLFDFGIIGEQLVTVLYDWESDGPFIKNISLAIQGNAICIVQQISLKFFLQLKEMIKEDHKYNQNLKYNKESPHGIKY